MCEIQNPDRRWVGVNHSRGTLYWELGGVLVVFLVGNFVHLAANLIEVSPLVFGLATVNESLWEHLKMGFWPVVALALV